MSNETLLGLSSDIHDIAAQMAGVETILIHVSDGHITGHLHTGNALNLMASVVTRMNQSLCEIADKVHAIASA